MPNNLIQIGTITSSVLTYDQLNTILGERRGCFSDSTYAPCDGRSIAGSQLARVTNTNVAPDLRGKFMRGLNLFHAEGQAAVDPEKNDPNGLNRTPGSYQGDLLRSHSHTANSNSDFAHRGAPGMGLQADRGQEFQFLAPSITVDAFGGEETRPKNIGVFFYIKIN